MPLVVLAWASIGMAFFGVQGHGLYAGLGLMWFMVSPSFQFCSMLVAVAPWGPLFKDQSVSFGCDNEVIAHIVNSQSSSSTRVMHLVHRFLLYCLQFNILINSRNFSGVENKITNTLSHSQFHRF